MKSTCWTCDETAVKCLGSELEEKVIKTRIRDEERQNVLINEHHINYQNTNHLNYHNTNTNANKKRQIILITTIQIQIRKDKLSKSPQYKYKYK